MKRALVVAGLVVTVVGLHLVGEVALWDGRLGSDTTNNTSFGLARDNPELYARDPLFQAAGSTAFYPVLIQQLVNAGHAATGDPVAAVRLVAGVVAPIFLLGVFLLARRLSGSFPLACAVMVLSAGCVVHPFGGSWKLTAFYEFAPKYLFHGLLPLVLLVVHRTRGRPRAWPWVAVLLAAMIYVHPVSAPAWGVAVWVAWAWHARAERRWRPVLLAAGLAVLTVLPFARVFSVQGGLPADAGLDYPTLYATALGRFMPGYFSVEVSLARYAVLLVGQWPATLLYLAMGALGWRAATRSDDPERRAAARWWTVALVAFFAFSVGLPRVEQAVCAALGRMPLEIDLIRGLRFWPLWCLLFGLLGWPEWVASARRRTRVAAAVVAAALCVAPNGPLHRATMTWGAVALVHPAHPQLARTREARRLLTQFVGLARARVPREATVLGPLWVRTHLQRSLGFAFKDGGNLYYASDWARLARWREDAIAVVAEAPAGRRTSQLERIPVWGAHVSDVLDARARLEPGRYTGRESAALYTRLGVDFVVAENVDPATLRGDVVCGDPVDPARPAIRRYCLVRVSVRAAPSAPNQASRTNSAHNSRP